jgi:hypothetical protein
MTLNEIGWLIVVGAVVLAAAATRFDVSPWRIFGLASIATLVTAVLAAHVTGEACGFSARTGADDRLFEVMIVSSLTLYAASALAGVVDGIRLGRRGDSERAISRAVGVPIVSVMGVGIVFFAFLYAIGPCLG